MYKNIFNLLEFFFLLLSLVTILSVGHIDDLDILVMVTMLYISGIIAQTALKHDISHLIISTYRHYIILAVYAKLIIILLAPELTLGSLTKVGVGEYDGQLLNAVVMFLIGSLGIYIGLFFADNIYQLFSRTQKFETNFNIPQHTYKSICIVMILILLKFILIQTLDLAKPGTNPVELPIPMLTGLLNTYCIHIVLIACTYLLVVRCKNTYLIFIPVLINIAIDVSNGYKFSLITTILVMAIVHLRGSNISVFDYIVRNKSLVLACFCLLLLYPILDSYSDLTASGVNVDIYKLLHMALGNIDSSTFYIPVTEIVRRVNGIDTYVIMNFFIGANDIKVRALFDNSITQVINNGMYGVSNDVVSAAGSTLFLPLRKSLGLLGSFIFLVFFTFIFASLIKVMLSKFQNNTVVSRLFMAFMSLEFCRYLFSSGDIINNMKVTVIYCFSFWYLHYISKNKLLGINDGKR